MQKKQEDPKDPHVTMKDELIPVLDSLERTYEAACYEMGLANWNSYSKEGPADLDSAKQGFAKLFLNTKLRTLIDDWRAKSNSLADKELARRLEMWHRCFIGGAVYSDHDVAALENSLQQRITDFPLTFNGAKITRAQVSTRLRSEPNQKIRKKLWLVPSQISAKVADDLRAVVALRNKKAKAGKFYNYYSLSLYLQSVDEEWLLKTLALLEEKTRPAFQQFIDDAKKKYRLKEFGPWDFDFALSKAASLSDKYFPSDSVFGAIHHFQKGIGFGVDSLPIREVVKDIPYGGLSLALRIPSDVRFLVNPTKGKGFYVSAFHEYGHSLKAVHVKVERPIFKGYEWIPGAQCAAYEEGIAEMHAELTEDSLWLTRFTKAPVKEIDRYLTDRRFPTIFRLRRLLKDFYVEHEMYKNPDQDMAEVERRMLKKYLLVDVDSSMPHTYASSIWYTSYPCYYQNYILAAMIATQLQEAMTDVFGAEKISDRRVAPWMIEHLYADGETLEWNERIRSASGKQLEPGAYLRKLGIEVSRLIHKE